MIIAGDFNSTRQGAAYQILSAGEITPDFKEYGFDVVKGKYTIEWTFKDAYAGKPNDPSFFNPFIPVSLLDFIFYHGNLKVQSTRQVTIIVCAKARGYDILS